MKRHKKILFIPTEFDGIDKIVFIERESKPKSRFRKIIRISWFKKHKR